jgi:hypothetical protein
LLDLNHVRPLSEFKRYTTKVLSLLHGTGKPVLLTLNGRAEVIVQDAAAYQQLLDYVERLEKDAGVRNGENLWDRARDETTA